MAGSLIFDLAADVARLRRDMQQANNIITSSFNSIKRAAGAIGITVGAAFAVGMARSLASSILATYEQGEALANLAERIGTTTEALSGLQYAASFSNVSTDDLTNGFRFLNKAMLDARDPSSTAASAIRAIGLNVEQLRNQDPAEAFRTIATAISGFQDGAEKGAVVTALFGRSAQGMIPFLNQGGDSINALTQEASDYGLVLSGDVAQAMSEFNNQITRIQAIATGLQNQLAIAMLPALEALSQVFLDGAKSGTGLHQVFGWVAEQAIRTAADITQLSGQVRQFINTVRAWGEIAGSVGRLDFSAAGERFTQMQQDNAKATADLNAQVSRMRSEGRARYQGLIDGVTGVGDAASGAGRKVLGFSDELDKTGRKATRAKTQVDEYAQMLKQLQEELRRTAANGDEMQLLLTDPRLATFSQQQIEQLVSLKQANLNLAAAQDEAKRAHDEFVKREEAAGEAHVKNIERLRDLASSTLDALDPTREYIRGIEDLIAAQDAGFLSTQQFADAQTMLAEKMIAAKDRMDPLKEKLDDLKNAVLGWGKQASDTFIDFISGAGNASQSFGEMTASILRDIAKMLVYKNFLEPLFKGLSGGGWDGFLGGGGGSILGGLFASGYPGSLTYGGQRMAGGPVLPGQLYRVNESPFAAEFFRPNLPGNVVRNGGDTAMNVYVTLNTSTGETDVQGNTAQAVELSKRIAMQVRSIIATEKRSGGLLAT